MIVLMALVVFCGTMGFCSLQLSPAAGRVPAIVALMTLVPILLQARAEYHGRGLVEAESKETVPLFYLLLLGSLYVAGFFITLPLYAGWCFRSRPVFAGFSIVLVLVMLMLLDQHAAVYSGLMWGLMASAAV